MLVDIETVIIKMMPNKKYLIEKNRNKKQNNKL